MRPQRSGWKAMRLAEADGISRMTMLFDSEIVEPLRTGAAFPSLATCGFLLDRTSLSQLDLGPVTAGWREFGMIGTRPGSEWSAGTVSYGRTAWVFLFEWNPVRSAWDGLLDAQDTLKPERLSLPPDFLLPSMFLARMAYFPLEPGVESTAAGWLACLARAQKKLSPLLTGLVTEWTGGSSQAAIRYRRLTGGSVAQSEEQQQALRRWKQVFGPTLLRQVRTAERIEPTIMRGLEAASVHLWTDRSLEIAENRLSLLSALLPIARWQPVPPGPAALAAPALASLETLVQAWKDWRAKGGER